MVALMCLWLGPVNQAPAFAEALENHAVILVYHRFGENDYPTTNIRIEQFEAHIEELERGDYTVLPVPEILARLKNGPALPDRTVGLTVDDAYLSVHGQALPRLRQAGFPFTLFVATEPVDAGYSRYLTWDQIRALVADGVTIGHHGTAHGHMPDWPESRVRRDLEAANHRFRVELGRAPDMFAYPYGEISSALVAVVRDMNFKAAWGQQSGVAHGGSDFFTLPRFAMNESYGGLERFRLVTNAMALPVSDLTPADPMLEVNPPLFGFTVEAGVGGLGALACFASHTGAARLERLGDRRFEVRLDAAFPEGRGRFNCTLPAGQGRWRWFGRQFYIPAALRN